MRESKRVGVAPHYEDVLLPRATKGGVRVGAPGCYHYRIILYGTSGGPCGPLCDIDFDYDRAHLRELTRFEVGSLRQTRLSLPREQRRPPALRGEVRLRALEESDLRAEGVSFRCSRETGDPTPDYDDPHDANPVFLIRL